MFPSPIAGFAPDTVLHLPTTSLVPSPLALAIYGEPQIDTGALRASIETSGILEPLIVNPLPGAQTYEILSGHRRWACAQQLGFTQLPCIARQIDSEPLRLRAILDHNRKRNKSFSQLMREADALESLLGPATRQRRNSHLKKGQRLPFAEQYGDHPDTQPFPIPWLDYDPSDRSLASTPLPTVHPAPDHQDSRPAFRFVPRNPVRRNFDKRECPMSQEPETECSVRRNFDKRECQADSHPSTSPPQPAPQPPPRLDQFIASYLEIGNKDTYRKARLIWKAANQNNPLALQLLPLLEQGRLSIHAVFQNLRAARGTPALASLSPSDLWLCRDPIPHTEDWNDTLPADLLVNLVHHFSEPGQRIVDPLAGSGSLIDVARKLQRTCQAWDIRPTRPDIAYNNLLDGYPAEASGCDLVFLHLPCRPSPLLPPHHHQDLIANLSRDDYLAFLESLARRTFDTIAPGGHAAILTEPAIPCSDPRLQSYFDCTIYTFMYFLNTQFIPMRRIACPALGRDTRLSLRFARHTRQLVPRIRDLLVFRKPFQY